MPFQLLFDKVEDGITKGFEKFVLMGEQGMHSLDFAIKKPLTTFSSKYFIISSSLRT